MEAAGHTRLRATCGVMARHVVWLAANVAGVLLASTRASVSDGAVVRLRGTRLTVPARACSPHPRARSPRVERNQETLLRECGHSRRCQWREEGVNRVRRSDAWRTRTRAARGRAQAKPVVGCVGCRYTASPRRERPRSQGTPVPPRCPQRQPARRAQLLRLNWLRE